MLNKLNKFLDRLSEYLAARKGLLILIGIVLVAINWILRLIGQPIWLIHSDPLLHIGIIVALIGILLAWAL